MMALETLSGISHSRAKVRHKCRNECMVYYLSHNADLLPQEPASVVLEPPPPP